VTRSNTEMVYPPTDGHPFKYYRNPAVHGRESNSQPAAVQQCSSWSRRNESRLSISLGVIGIR